MTRLRPAALAAVLALAGCRQSPPETQSLPEARQGFQTQLTRKERAGTSVETPPAKLFQLVKYDAPPGKLSAYLTPDPKDKKQHPAIVWITGGDCNSIDKGCWQKGPAGNDQSASQYREAGVVMMFPSLRGGNDNPGVKEGFFGEVDDVIAAAEFLAKQDYVDPKRIYLGGHSTGGTLVMLVAASTDRFRAVFSFGPVEDVRGYPDEFVPPCDRSNRREFELRSPGRWLHSIKCPTFVFEGTNKGNIDSLRSMSRANQNPLVHFHPVPAADHFSTLAPLNAMIAAKILKDDGPSTNISFTETEIENRHGR